jgi:hypothetical protein
MGYWDTIDWQKVKKDIQKGWKEGVVAVKQGAVVAQKKAGELTEEGKRRYKVLELKTKVHKRVYDLGERVHVLLTGRKRVANPALDAAVKAIMTDIGRMESQITKFEGKKAAAKTAPKGRKTRTAPKSKKA